MRLMLCILALVVLGTSTADAYVRRTIGGGHVVRGAGAYSGRYAGGAYGRGYYGHPVARGAALAATGAAIGWGWNQPYDDGGYAYNDDYGYDNGSGRTVYVVTGPPALVPRYYGSYAASDYYDAYAADGYAGSCGGYAGGCGVYPAAYGGYAGYYGGYANRSYITGRPTLFPRYYGNGW